MDRMKRHMRGRLERSAAPRVAAVLVLGVIVLAVTALAVVRGDPSTPAPTGPDAGAATPEPGALESLRAATAAAGPDALPGGALAAGPAPEGGWAAPDAPVPVLIRPAHLRVPRPESVRGLYVSAWSAGSSRKLDRLLRLADSTEINSFVIDIKDATGYVSYDTQVPLARQVEANGEIRIRDVERVLERMREHGVYPIARIVVFKDPLLAGRRPEWSIRTDSGGVWTDEKGFHWVDAFNEHVWKYNVSIAKEAVALGFSEVQWDYVRFPDAPDSLMERAVYPERNGRLRVDAIREFMRWSGAELAALDVPVTADVFGITASARNDVGIGQHWESMSDVIDVLLPMVYPSHYPPGSFGIEHPNGDPYHIVKRAMGDAVERSDTIEGAAEIRPWLQDFSLGEPPYGPAYVRAQIEAVHDAGLDEWVLWNPASNYTAEALAGADGEPPDLPDLDRLMDDDLLPLPELRIVPLGEPADSARGAPVPRPRP